MNGFILAGLYFLSAILITEVVDSIVFNGTEDSRSITIGVLWPLLLPMVLVLCLVKVSKIAWQGMKDLLRYGIK